MSVEHNVQNNRFLIDTEKGTAELIYKINYGELDIRRTFVPPALRGQGIAAKLVQAACDYAKKHGLKPVASCSYAVLWLQRHPEYNGETGKDYDGENSCSL